MFSYNRKLIQGKARSLKKRDIIYNQEWKLKTHFSGKSPPEIFVGRFTYPHVNAGILSPDSFENTEEMSYPEIWHEKNFSIHDILSRRNKLIYGRFKADIKKKNKFLNIMQELSMAHKSVSTEFFLKKTPLNHVEINRYSPIIANPAPLENARLQENPTINPKIDYIVSDIHVKATESMKELYNYNIHITNINKILSAGLLGLRSQRKLVPTRWSITTVDDSLSKALLKKIRYYQEINDILLFNAEYNGNHYEILLLPDKFSLEVIEIELINGKVWQDYELFYGRKTYAENVVGAYYANRLALCEYLEKIKKQATAIFFREVRPEYYAPLGVGILRETSREAFNKTPEKFNTLDEALQIAQSRLKIPITNFIEKSMLLKEFGKQKKLNKWF